jgi:hypothetical protein
MTDSRELRGLVGGLRSLARLRRVVRDREILANDGLGGADAAAGRGLHLLLAEGRESALDEG